MAKKDKKTPKREVRPAQLPAVLASGTIVPFAVGFGIGVATTDSMSIGLLIGLLLGIAYWFIFVTGKKPDTPEIPTKTSDDIVMDVMSRYAFDAAEPTDVETRPEAYSLDGERWSHKLTFESTGGEKDIFVIRGSLITGEGWLEDIPGESRFLNQEWMLNDQGNPPDWLLFMEENSGVYENDLLGTQELEVEEMPTEVHSKVEEPESQFSNLTPESQPPDYSTG